MAIVRTFLLLMHIAVVALLCGTFLNAYVPPKIFGYLNLLSLAFPVLMMVHFFLTFFWIFTWKKRAFFFLLISLLFFNPVRRWINYNPNSGKTGSLKVVTFNSKTYATAASESKLLAFIKEQNADIVLLQENYLPQKDGYIQDEIIGLKTKHKILKQEKLIADGSNAYSFYADIDANGKIIRVVNVYLQPFQLEKSMVRPSKDIEVNKQKAQKLIFRLVPTFKDHQEQVKMIRKAIDHSPYPVILAGDFNSVPNSWEYYHLSEGLKDAFVEAGNGSATSFHDYKFPIRIDYIFSSGKIKPVSYQVDRSVKISDHYPVIATFDY